MYQPSDFVDNAIWLAVDRLPSCEASTSLSSACLSAAGHIGRLLRLFSDLDMGYMTITDTKSPGS